ncbi:hypothetical protein MKQ68_23995 [Chitinophaga horti]|uniref:Uncharacterized protein n=1 Tax=Chitinophaga horti TaxID=2920382 RepID=A0ABY6J0S5_9BACT|nr:hypothetical protein [Chitinophaga horti]UYQ93148.1 hypothetical protein MKQ68_23995 [Chitinophaga horti]
MEIPTQTSEQQEQLLSWKHEVEDVRQDVKSMRNRLEAISQHHSGNERMVKVERFQNQFIRQLEVADELFHDLKQANRRLNNALIEHTDRPVDDHDGLHERMDTFHKLYNELRNDFQQFEAHQ